MVGWTGEKREISKRYKYFMKLLYIANARIPTEKAYGINIIKMCQALAMVGAELTLVIPQRKNAIKQDVFSYYGVEKNFIVEYVPIVDFVAKGFLGYWISQLFFSLKLLFKKIDKGIPILTRDEWSGWLLAKFGYQVFYDMHGFPVTWQWLWKLSMKSMRGIFCTNQWKIEQCNRRFGIPREKLVLARNGFDEQSFAVELTKKEAREKTGLPVDKRIVIYTGHLYDWKGAEILAEAAKTLPDILFVFVGGSKTEVNDFSSRYRQNNNILFLGQKSHKDIPLYLWSADVLVLPNSVKSENPRFTGYSVFDTSPIKMFEYMASGRPIIASDLPAIREVLSEKNAILVASDSPDLLAETIKDFLAHQEKFDSLAKQGLVDVVEFTWKKRAEKILEFIGK